MSEVIAEIWDLLVEKISLLLPILEDKENLTHSRILRYRKQIVNALSMIDKYSEHFTSTRTADVVDVGDLIYKFEVLLLEFTPPNTPSRMSVWNRRRGLR